MSLVQLVSYRYQSTDRRNQFMHPSSNKLYYSAILHNSVKAFALVKSVTAALVFSQFFLNHQCYNYVKSFSSLIFMYAIFSCYSFIPKMLMKRTGINSEELGYLVCKRVCIILSVLLNLARHTVWFVRLAHSARENKMTIVHNRLLAIAA